MLESVALEVRRGLVSAEGARRYGVVVGADGVLDAAGTEGVADGVAGLGGDGEKPVFNMGPALPDQVLERCEEETGLPAPLTPVWT